MSKSKPPEEFVDEIIKYIKGLSHDDAMDFACNAMFNIALWAGDNHIEIMGISECVRADLIEFVVLADRDDDDDDADEWKKLINRN